MARRGWYESEEARREVDRMAAAGVDCVALMVNVMQERYSSTRMFSDFRFTVSDWELLEIIEAIRARGMRVMLKPVIECHDSVWRGQIRFPEGDQQIQGVVTDYWGPWFESLTASLVHYARLATRGRAEMFCLGCELRGTETRSDDWRRVLGRVRDVYEGVVTYNAAGHYSLRPGELPDWYRDLDLLALSYYAGADVEPTVEALSEALAPTVERLGEVSRDVGLPLLFAEVGCRSVEGAVRCPAQHQNVADYDGQVQATWLEAIWRLFSGQSWWAGMFWWKWDEQQDRPQYDRPGGDTGFTVAGKPAEETMGRLFRQDRGEQ